MLQVIISSSKRFLPPYIPLPIFYSLRSHPFPSCTAYSPIFFPSSFLYLTLYNLLPPSPQPTHPIFSTIPAIHSLYLFHHPPHSTFHTLIPFPSFKINVSNYIKRVDILYDLYYIINTTYSNTYKRCVERRIEWKIKEKFKRRCR